MFREAFESGGESLLSVRRFRQVATHVFALREHLPRNELDRVGTGFGVNFARMDEQALLELFDGFACGADGSGIDPIEQLVRIRAEKTHLPWLPRPSDANHLGPKASVNECHFTVHQSRHEDIIMVFECATDTKNQASGRMPPPRALDRLVRNQRCETWQRRIVEEQEPVTRQGSNYVLERALDVRRRHRAHRLRITDNLGFRGQ